MKLEELEEEMGRNQAMQRTILLSGREMRLMMMMMMMTPRGIIDEG